MVTEADVTAGKVKNIAKATGKDPGNNDITDDGETEDPTDPVNAKLEVTKVSNLASGTKASVGQKLTYTVTVKNTGNVTTTHRHPGGR